MANDQLTTRDFFQREDVKKRFEEMLGKKAPQFITSVLQIASSNELLKKADPVSIYNSAAVAATLDLPLNNALGYAYIVPFNTKQPDGSYKVVAQFQLGAKGFRQLAMRSGQFLVLNETDVREGEIKSINKLTGEIQFEWEQDFAIRESKKIIGYVSYFKLQNGFEQTFYMPVEKIISHGKRYSQTFKKGYGLWVDDFDAMARKTVSKLNLSKNAPLSIEMQKAIVFDQSVVKDYSKEEVEYVDTEVEIIDKEIERVMLMIEDADSVAKLKKLEPNIPVELRDTYDFKMEVLTANEKPNGK